jgi:hypothetical protein
MSSKSWLAGLIALGMSACALAAHAQPAPTPLPSPDYPLLPPLSDAIAIGDAGNRIQLAFDSVDEPNQRPGVERPLQIEIPVFLAGGLQAPLTLTQVVFVEKGVAPTDLGYVSDIIDGLIHLDAAGLCCELTIEMFSDSDFITGVPIGQAGGIDPNAVFLFETGRYQDITAALDLDVLCGPPAAQVPCVQNPTTGKGLLVLAASDVSVPEPTAWALMLTGLALAGSALRSARSVRAWA